MRFLALFLLALPAYAAVNDIADNYITWNQFGAFLPWKTPGGDWTDKNGTYRGSVPYGSAVMSSPVPIVVDVTGAGNALYLHWSGTTMFYAREGGQPAKLTVTLEDGSQQEFFASADTALTPTTGNSIGNRAYLSYNDAVVAFPELPKHVKAELTLYPSTQYFRWGQLQVYKLLVPQPNSDPVVAVKTFDSLPTGQMGKGCRNTYVVENGFRGKALEIRYTPAQLNVETCIGDVDLKDEDHMFFRYYLKYGGDWRDADVCDGGKHPGFANPNDFAGNGGSPVNGLNGWSLRQGYSLNCDKNNPAYPRVAFNTYAYHADMKDWYGDHWYNGVDGLLELEKWYCIEGEVKVNTPGVRDGITRTWIDGKLTLEKTNLYLRAVKPPQGYGDWRTAPLAGAPTYVDPTTGKTFYLYGRILPGNLGITKWWSTFHHGGKYPFSYSKPSSAYIDEVVVSRSRIGCAY